MAETWDDVRTYLNNRTSEWTSDDEDIVLDTIVQAAHTYIDYLENDHWPPPDAVYGMPGGTVQFEWRFDNGVRRYVEVEGEFKGHAMLSPPDVTVISAFKDVTWPSKPFKTIRHIRLQALLENDDEPILDEGGTMMSIQEAVEYIAPKTITNAKEGGRRYKEVEKHNVVQLKHQEALAKWFEDARIGDVLTHHPDDQTTELFIVVAHTNTCVLSTQC